MSTRGREQDREKLDAAWRPVVPRPVAGLPAAADLGTDCLRCKGWFEMRVERLMLFEHRSTRRGYLCLPCLDHLNENRVALGLSAFPVPILGYHGGEFTSWPGPLAPVEWAAGRDGRRLLQYAAGRIPPQHVGLLLTSLALTVCPRLAEEAPFAFGIATLRAWCHGEASAAELERAFPLLQGEALDELPPATVYAFRAIGEALVLAFFVARSESKRVSPGFFGNQAAHVLEQLIRSAVEDASERGVLERETREVLLDRAAKLVRAQLPFPHEASIRWERSPGLAIAGMAVLRIDGWEIGDAVSLDEFSSLSGPRAVAFDAAQSGREEFVQGRG